MFCPNYTNKEVFDAFNEIVEALGGKPMTGEEFRNKDVRLQRTGADLHAAKAAYRVWNRNQGNPIDEAPNGLKSILFLSLLDHFGDKLKAVVAKTNVYSDEFFNWFGDWTAEEKENVSKVVDENGEPLVMYHFSKANFDTFSYDYVKHAESGFFFSSDRNYAAPYGSEEYGVFLNVRNPMVTDIPLHRENLYKIYNEAFEKGNKTGDGVIGNDLLDDNLVPSEGWECMVFRPNQIKHVENLGTWNPGTANIYHAPQITEIPDPFQAMSFSDMFTEDVLQKLLNGDTVSSQELVNLLLTKDGVFTGRYFDLAQVLAKHDVPIRLSSIDLGYGVPASTIAENDGGRVVIINRESVTHITKRGFGEVFLHEIVHAVTLQALTSPKNATDRTFRNKASIAFNALNKVFNKLPHNALNSVGWYGLSSVEEFASVFATNYEARKIYYKIAKEIDRKYDKTFLGKFKEYVNAFVKLFVNKTVFKSNEEKLQDYEKYFVNYINNTPTIRQGNINENSSLRDVYSELTRTLIENEVINEQLLNIDRGIKHLKKVNFELSTEFVREKFNKDLPNNSNIDVIKSSILSRINALKNSNLPESIKQQLLLNAQSQLGMFENPEVSRYEAIAYLLDSLKPAIVNALEEVRQISKQEEVTAANSNYQFHQHQNIGWFDIVLKNIHEILNNETEVQKLLKAHNAKQTEENAINIKTINDLDGYIQELQTFVSSANAILTKILDRAALTDLHRIVSDVGSIEGMELVEELKKTGQVFKSDVSWMEMMFGQADAATNEVIRAAAHIIKQTDDTVVERLIDKGDELLKLLKNLKRGESVKDLYEMADGKPTQYLVRRLNFGKFEQDYRKFLAKLNKDYGLADNDVSGPLDENKRILWELEKNRWLNTHCHRKYTSTYYNAWAKVPMHVKAKLDKINGSIRALLDKYNVVDENGYYHYERVTDDEDWKTLLHLWSSKKQMRNPYTVNGELKQGEEKAVSDILNNLYKELYGDTYKEPKKNIKKWREAREKIIEECGGQEEYQKYQKDEKNNFNFDKLDKWDQRNSRYQFKKDSEGNAIVFKEIEREMKGFKFDYGKEYKDKEEKVKDLLRPAYDLAGQVNPDFLSSKAKAEIANLYKEMAAIRRQVIATHPGYRELSQKYKDILDDYLTYVDTRYLTEIKRVTWQNVSVLDDEVLDFDENIFAMAMWEWGDVYESDGCFEFRPYKYLKTGIAKNSDFMEWVPNDAWAEQEEDDRYVNTKFDSSFGESRVPLESLYDNSAAWNKIQNSESLQKLYLAVVETLDLANLMQTNRTWTNMYRLPGVSMQLYERFRRNSALRWLQVLLDWAKEKMGIVNDLEEDIKLRDLTTSNDDNTSEGEEIHSEETHIVGVQPDGSRYMALPQYYTRRMKNPENISYELLDIVLSYYKMSLNYSERLKVRDTLETLADFVRSRSSSGTETATRKGHRRKTADKDDVSNLYRLMRNLLDMGLYNKVRTEYQLGKFKLSATFSTIQQYTTAVNLGWNKKVAAVGFMTAMFNHLLNARVGKEYSMKNLSWAMKEAATSVLKLFFTNKAYSLLPTDKVLVILKNFNIANQLERNYENTSLGKLARVWLLNHTFGYLASVDYLTKSLITIACLKNYKLIDGKFYSIYDIKTLQYDEPRYRKLVTEYKNAKSAYDLLYIKDGKLSISSEAEKAWIKDKSRIIAKCQKQSEKADGVCTGLQRAAVQRSWIGMFLMIHRQYLPLMLHERFGKRIYDYDTQEYTHGLFRLVYQYLMELTANTMLPGVLGGALAGYAIGNIPGLVILGGAAVSRRLWGMSKGKNKSLKQINYEFFRNYSNQKETIRSVENYYAIKQVVTENILFSAIRYLVVNPVCALADDDKDNWFLQSIAYWLKATLFEISVAYNYSDIMSNIKSPTAATVLLDRATYFGDNFADLLNAIGYALHLTDKEPKIIGKNSPYEGWYRWQKAMFLLFTPYHNEWEQNTPKGVRFKRGYLENQIISESDFDKYNLFDEFE